MPDCRLEALRCRSRLSCRRITSLSLTTLTSTIPRLCNFLTFFHHPHSPSFNPCLLRTSDLRLFHSTLYSSTSFLVVCSLDNSSRFFCCSTLKTFSSFYCNFIRSLPSIICVSLFILAHICSGIRLLCMGLIFT